MARSSIIAHGHRHTLDANGKLQQQAAQRGTDRQHKFGVTQDMRGVRGKLCDGEGSRRSHAAAAVAHNIEPWLLTLYIDKFPKV